MDLSKIELITDPSDKRLHERVKAVPVGKINSPKVFAIVQKMKEIQTAVGAVGLAANQIGVNMRIITCLHEGMGEIIEFINPRIIAESCHEENIEWDTEGCLSHPGITAEVARYSTFQMLAYRLNHTGELKLQLSGMIARIAQHEICHINGRLITDMEKYVRNIIPIPGGQVQLFAATNKSLEVGPQDFVAEE